MIVDSSALVAIITDEPEALAFSLTLNQPEAVHVFGGFLS